MPPSAVPSLEGMRPEDVDLRELAESLSRRFAESPPQGYLRGKALMRDALAHDRGLSDLEAEELVDTLEMNGYLRFLGDPSQRSMADAPWKFRLDPSVEVQSPESRQVVKIAGEER